MQDLVLLSGDAPSYVECSSPHVKTQGKLFKKMLFRFGEFAHPGNPAYKIKVDQKFYEDLKRNFDNGVCPIVQVPLADSENRHSEAPDRNIGRAVDLTADEEGIYAYLDIRKHAEDMGSTILGASAKVALNYVDTRNNTRVGPTLLHVAATNRPYLVDLKEYESVSLSTTDDTTNEEILLLTDGEVPDSVEEISMTQEELINELLTLGVDVAAGQRALSEVEGFVALSSVLGEDAAVTPEAVASTIVDLTASIASRDEQIAAQEDTIQKLTAEVQTINLSAATAEVEGLIKAGRILPAWKDDMIELSLTDRDRFNIFLLPEDKVDVGEVGFSHTQDPHDEAPEVTAQAEGSRIANLANSTK